MQNSSYQRFAITVPSGMATQIDELCRLEGRNRSEFFREAVRFYVGARRSAQTPTFVMPTPAEERQENPFRLFSEWDSEADAVYDTLR